MLQRTALGPLNSVMFCVCEYVRESEVTLSAVVRACGELWWIALQLALAPETKALCNEVVRHAAISACERAGQWEAALHLLSSLSSVQAVREEIMYTSAIGACARSLQWQRAIQLLSAMRAEVVEPTEISYSAAMGACHEAGKFKPALSHMSEETCVRALRRIRFCGARNCRGTGPVRFSHKAWLVCRHRASTRSS